MMPEVNDPWRQQYSQSLERLFRRYGLIPRFRTIPLKDPAVQVHLLEVGDGLPLILLHGGNGSAADWAPLAAALAPKFHLYLLEMPGHGLSELIDFHGMDVAGYAARWLHAVMAELKLAQAGFVANSIGGYWALAFALAHPEQVSKIVLAGAPGGFESRVPPAFRLMSAGGLGRLLAAQAVRSSHALIRRVLSVAVADIRRVPDEYIDATWHAARIPGRVQSYRTMVRQLSPFCGPSRMRSIRRDVARLERPVLLVWGDCDAFGEPTTAQEACAAMPSARLAMVPGAGHLPWMDDPERVGQLVTGFFERPN